MDREMRQVLAELELTSNGTTASVDSSHGAFGSREPRSGDAHPPFVLYRDAWMAETSERGRERVLHEAMRELKALRRREATEHQGETKAERDKRIIEDGKGWQASDVATNFRCSITEVRKARLAAYCDADSGLPMVGVKSTGKSLQASIKEMAEQGVSQRRIAEVFGLSQPTVHRYLKVSR